MECEHTHPEMTWEQINGICHFRTRWPSVNNVDFSWEAFLSQERREQRWSVLGLGACRGPGIRAAGQGLEGKACLAGVVGLEVVWRCEASREMCWPRLELAWWSPASPRGGQSDGKGVTEQERNSSGRRSLAGGGGEGRAVREGMWLWVSRGKAENLIQNDARGPGEDPHFTSQHLWAISFRSCREQVLRPSECLWGLPVCRVTGLGASEGWPRVSQCSPEEQSGGECCL